MQAVCNWGGTAVNNNRPQVRFGDFCFLKRKSPSVKRNLNQYLKGRKKCLKSYQICL